MTIGLKIAIVLIIIGMLVVGVVVGAAIIEDRNNREDYYEQ